MANLFEVPSGCVIPVVFGDSATTATTELGSMSIKQLIAEQCLNEHCVSGFG